MTRRALASQLLVFVTLAATFQAGAWYHQRTAAAAATDQFRVLHYACPMHPAYTSDRPGDAPCCGMRLEPVYAGGSKTDAVAPAPELPQGTIAVGPWQQQLIGARVEVVQEVAGDHTLRLPGRVAPDERRVYSLNAGVDGTIREVSGVTTGSRVSRHQLLATYTAPDFLLAVQSYILALDGLEKRKASRAQDDAEDSDGQETVQGVALPPIISKREGGLVVNSGSSNFQQRIDRLHLLGMPDVQIEEVGRMRDVPGSIKIVAPVEGTVLGRNVAPGQKFMRGEEWFRIVDLRHVWILVDVPGAEVRHVRPGQPVRVHLPDLGQSIVARVSDAAPRFDAETRTFKLRLDADNPGEMLRPDMLADVDLPVPFSAALAVPSDAVVNTGLAQVVYVEQAPGEFQRREVVTGWRRGDRVQVLRGLTAGDRIVTSGTFLLESESRMRKGAVRAAAETPATATSPAGGER